MQFSGEQFDINVELVKSNAEIVTDFFGDNRKWYEQLKNGGQMYGKVSLTSSNEYDEDDKNPDENDLPPLDPSKITEERAKSITAFFRETPEAKKAFEEYFAHNQKSIGTTN